MRTSLLFPADAAALENRTVADYTYEFDDGEFGKTILEGEAIVLMQKAFFQNKLRTLDPNSPTFNKDAPSLNL